MGIRVNKALRDLNVSLKDVVDFLNSLPGLELGKEIYPNTKLSDTQYDALKNRFLQNRVIREQTNSITTNIKKPEAPFTIKSENRKMEVKVVGKIDLDSLNQTTRPKKKSKEERKKERLAKNSEWLSKMENNSLLEDGNLKDKGNIINEKSEREQKITLDQLRFGDGFIIYKNGKNVFVFHNKMFSTHLNKYKNDYRIKGVTTSIKLNFSTGTFSFVKRSVLKNLEAFKLFVDKELASSYIKESDSKKKRKENRNDVKTKIEHRIPFSTIRFGQGLSTIIYKKERYVYKDYNIKDYDIILWQVYNRVSKARKNSILNSRVCVVIDTESRTFTFKYFDINRYIYNLKESFLPEIKNVGTINSSPSRDKAIKQKPLSSSKSMTLVAGNIRFYNGYFLIFRTANGEIDNTLAPYRVNDPDSHEILNLVHNYFEQRFEQMRIVVKHNDANILEPSKPDLFQLRNYVRALRRNLEVKGKWWEEVQNARKRTFAQCYGESRDSVKSRYVKSKSEYLYNLSSLQNEKKLIRVYEINHGKEEDAFIFTIDMAGNRNAIVFENASNDASTTTWVFVAKKDNYEDCINMVFNYFTDYTIHSKRSSLRAKTVNPPEKFKAESYAFIDHDDLEQWLKKLNNVLENSPQPSEVNFVPGLNVPQSAETRTPSSNSITPRNIHNQLMLKLYEKLCNESGKENVGTEIRVGTKRIDAVVKGDGFYDIYEVKTASNSFDCVTEALGQICQYAYLYCRDKIGKMVIVGAAAASPEVDQYLSWFRKKYSMEVYYMQVPLKEYTYAMGERLQKNV